MPSDGKGGQRESKIRVRAHFEYNPENDPYIPCKEAGLGFTRGEILHIVGQVLFFLPLSLSISFFLLSSFHLNKKNE